MKYLYIVLVILVFYLLIEFGRFYYKYTHLPVLEDYKHSEVIFGQGTPIRYIAAGDSTAVGVGASAIENGYTNKLAAELAKNNLVTYKNVAVTGSRTQDVLDKQVVEIIEFKPDIVTISIGANDATHLVSGKTILVNDKKVIQELTQKTQAKIYLTNVANLGWANILPWFYRGLIEFRTASVNKALLKLETDRVKIVNIHDFGWSKFPNLEETNAPDSFHPNDIGYQNWTEAFLDKISKE